MTFLSQLNASSVNLRNSETSNSTSTRGPLANGETSWVVRKYDPEALLNRKKV